MVPPLDRVLDAWRTQKLHRDYTEITQRLHRDYTEITQRLHRDRSSNSLVGVALITPDGYTDYLAAACTR